MSLWGATALEEVKTPGDALNFKTYGSDYYEEKFPGFNEDFYKILAESTKG